ncbi:MAG TPA: hypothetical protein PKX05_05385, partial [bacterium]|nr:hypothetical protein [bacterium]
WKNGGKMENWLEGFVFNRWLCSMEKNHLDFDDYLGDSLSICNRWKHIRASFSFERLEAMRNTFYYSISHVK